MENDKLLTFNHDIVDNATDDDIIALNIQYSRGDAAAVNAVRILEKAASMGDTSAERLIERSNKIATEKNKGFVDLLLNDDPGAVEYSRGIADRLKEGTLTPGDREFILDYVTPGEEDVEALIASVISDPTAVNAFLEGLTPAKIKKALPAYELTPQEEKDLVYTAEEAAIIRRSGSEAEKEAARAARRERARRFLSGLYLGDFIALVKPEAREEKKNGITQIKTSAPAEINYPVDKINNNIWDDLSALPINNNGQIVFATEKRGSNKEANVLYSIDFSELEKIEGLKLTKNLTAFDKRVYIAVGAMFSSQGNYTSVSQIFTAMGGKGKPKAAQLERINDSLTKMGATRVFLDNSQETPVNEKYPAFKYDAALLPFERVSAYVNNALTESAIHLFREPPLITFARERKQITTFPRELLSIPLNQTEENLKIEDYLIERIASMKNAGKKQSRKMLLSTIFERCKINGTSGKDRKARHDAPEKIKKCLDHFTSVGYIAGYKKEKDAITIILKNDK